MFAECKSKLMADNLRRIDRLPRHGLMLYLDKETSKTNTKRLRAKARLHAIEADSVEADFDLSRIERILGNPE